MNVWWKLGIIAGYTLFIFAVAWHTKGKFDQAAQTELLRQQIAAANAAQQKISEQAQSAEADLADIRQKYATLNQRWSKIRAESPSHCKLPDGVVGLLKDATSDHPKLSGQPDAGL